MYICRQIMFKNVYFADTDWRSLKYDNVSMWQDQRVFSEFYVDVLLHNKKIKISGKVFLRKRIICAFS